MTGDAADLFNLHQEHVLVAIQSHLQHFLGMAGFLALVPQFLAGTRPVHRLAGFHGALQRFPVHPGHHEDVAGFRILGDGRQQAVLGPVDLVQPGFAHNLTSIFLFRP
jgi:hypothetical protein